ncbi:hypothetical protein F4809DRAFT_406853 [Biscogniauxia mediterranea]|nr:hypothetical protein F4809DRAFT_406853 [Biscogniauxia mediterranea]
MKRRLRLGKLACVEKRAFGRVLLSCWVVPLVGPASLKLGRLLAGDLTGFPLPYLLPFLLFFSISNRCCSGMIM